MGSGFRTFTAGEVLSASNVQNYLQDQVVMTFAGSAARSSAIGTANFEEGMVSYLTDTDKVEAYNGTNWVQVGSSNQGLNLINTTSFSGVSSFSLAADTFTSTYRNYKIVITATSTATAVNELNIRLRASGADNTTSNYYLFRYRLLSSGASNAYENNNLLKFGLHSSHWASTIDVLQPKTATNTMLFSTNTALGTDSGGEFLAGQFNGSTSFDSASIIVASGNITGQYSVYGYNA